MKPLQIQNRRNAEGTANRARGGRVNLSGAQRNKKSKSKTKGKVEMPTPPAAVAAPTGVAPMMAGVPPVGMMGNKPGYASGGTHNFIQKAVAGGKGKFRAKAKAAGKTTAEFAKEKEHAPGKVGQEARLAETLMHLRRKQ